MQEKEINNNKNSIYIRVRHGFSLLSWFCKRLFCRHMKSKAASDGLKVYAFFINLFCYSVHLSHDNFIVNRNTLTFLTDLISWKKISRKIFLN